MTKIHWPSFLRELDAAERTWNTRDVSYPRDDAVHWQPYAVPSFVALLTEAMTCAPYRQYSQVGWLEAASDWSPDALRMIDVGCGPGTKLRLAQEMFGLNVYGIDLVQRFVDEAMHYGIRAQCVDAFELPEHGSKGTATPWGYADFDIVYVNRPSGLQDELEPLIMERMAPSAVLVAVNWRNNPGKSGWASQYEEFGEPVCGVWVKPQTTPKP
jgi:SAM-dependent methyltransferase